MDSLRQTIRQILQEELHSLLHDVSYRIRTLEDLQKNHDRVHSSDLNLATHMLDGYSFTDDSPSAGYVSWVDVNIVYKGQTYAIQDGNTNMKYIWWDFSATDPTVLQTSNTKPTITQDDVLIGINDNGTFHLTMAPGKPTPGGAILSGSISSNELGAGSVISSVLADNAVTSSKIDSNAVTSPKISSGAVTNGKIATGAVQTGNLADGAVSGVKIQDLAVSTGKLTDGAVQSTKLATGAVTTGKISSQAVTGSKIADGAVDTTQLAAGAIATEHLAANAVTANKINVSTLSAISADLGKVTAGEIHSVKFVSGKNGYDSENWVELDNGDLTVYVDGSPSSDPDPYAGELSYTPVWDSGLSESGVNWRLYTSFGQIDIHTYWGNLLLRSSNGEINIDGIRGTNISGYSLSLSSNNSIDITSDGSLAINTGSGHDLYLNSGTTQIIFNNGQGSIGMGGSAVRWRYDGNNYIRQQSDGKVDFIASIGATFNFFHQPNKNNHRFIQGGPAAGLKFLSTSATLQVRNADDTAYGSISASNFHTVSKSDYKTNIQDANFSALEYVSKTPVKMYELKNEPKKKQLGLLYEQSPDILKNDEETLSLYSMVALLWKAVQELRKEI